MTTMKKRLALLVGCNYPNTQHELHGCYNDVETMQTLLTNRFGFVKEDIKIMIDKQNEQEKPTGDNIRTALVEMIHGAKKGDTFFFFFSGLGALFESLENDKSPAIISCDFDAIRDYEFRLLVDYLPNGATFTFLADSSDSGGLILGAKEQEIIRRPDPGNDWEKKYRPKTFPIDVNSSIQSSNIRSSDISAHLSKVFGTQVTANFSSANSQSGCGCPQPPANDGILLSSCSKIQKSVEVDPNNNQSKAYGAFTNAVETTLKKNPGQITNRKLVQLAEDFLSLKGIGQHPCLFSSDKNADALFLGHKTG